MGNGAGVIEGLRQAVAHAKGEATGAREHVVHVPRPTLTPAQERARLVELQRQLAMRDQRHDPSDRARNERLRLVGEISFLRLKQQLREATGRRWLAEHGHGG